MIIWNLTLWLNPYLAAYMGKTTRSLASEMVPSLLLDRRTRMLRWRST